MLRISELQLPLDYEPDELRQAIVQRLGITTADLIDFSLFKRSYDARKKSRAIIFSCIVDVTVRDEQALLHRFADDRHIGAAPDISYHPVARAPQSLRERPLVVGFGPGGLFAALLLAQMGFRPIVLERGRDVRRRTADTWALWRKKILTPESNVQFGEGGAGLFSDGKLYSQIKDPKFYGRKVMREFVRAGAPQEILYLAKPHIGTFRLTGVVARMREEIIALGGEVRFENQSHGRADRRRRRSKAWCWPMARSSMAAMWCWHWATVRATPCACWSGAGYSWRPSRSPSAFASSIRSRMIDAARFGRFAGHPRLGAADYKLVHHAGNGRAVYSFCMCPGGTVVAATSEPRRVVTNGMSQYSRNERNANAGIVVGINPQADYPGGPLAGVALQEALESTAYRLGGEDYCAPGQLVGDFLRGVASTQLGQVQPSYQPGVRLGDLSPTLPDYAIDAIREALPAFGRQIRGFDREDAVLTGVESRTSSPVRITRDGESLQSLNVRGLYPCGEGAGYAGGILSAGVDGIRVAEAVARNLS